MKINIEIDLTPEEFRAAMGCPDVREIQQSVVDAVAEQLRAGAEDPVSLFKSWMDQGIVTAGELSKAFAASTKRTSSD